jgi:hypothetical protein
MSKFIIVFYMATLSFAHWAWGSQCLTIKGELKQMQLAHVQITKNLLDNYRMSSEQVSYTATRMHSDSPARRLYVRDQALRSAKAHKKRVKSLRLF